MDHYSRRRRHGLLLHEFGPVYKAVKQRLLQLLEDREDFHEAEALFKVLWRFENCKVGRPQYPEEINWQLITEYINGLFPPIPETQEIDEITAQQIIELGSYSEFSPSERGIHTILKGKIEKAVKNCADESKGARQQVEGASKAAPGGE